MSRAEASALTGFEWSLCLQIKFLSAKQGRLISKFEAEFQLTPSPGEPGVICVPKDLSSSPSLLYMIALGWFPAFHASSFPSLQTLVSLSLPSASVAAIAACRECPAAPTMMVEHDSRPTSKCGGQIQSALSTVPHPASDRLQALFSAGSTAPSAAARQQWTWTAAGWLCRD